MRRPQMVPRRELAATLAALAITITTSSAQTATVDFTVSGTSTVRNWTCSAQGVLSVAPAAAGTPLPGFATGVESAKLTVPVKSFRCPSDEMTQHLNEAMKAESFPEIVFTLDKYTVAGAQTQATGTINITGSAQPVTVPVTVRATDKGVQVEGNTRLEFATFGLEPPTVFLGMLKVGPQIRVGFKGLVAR